MAYSLGLTLYNLASRSAVESGATRPPRPAGPLIWLHAPGPDSLTQVTGLAARLEEEQGISVLLTSPSPPPTPHPGVIWQPTPADNPAESRAVLDHWTPDLIALAEGELRPALLHDAHQRGIPVVLIDARAPFILRDRDGWWPGLTRGLLDSIRSIAAVDQPAARAFRRAGANANKVQVTGRMEYPTTVLPCLEAERAELATLLATRPVWYAVGVPEAEEAAVFAAHRAALKLSHRLLLILSPRDPARIPALTEHLEQSEGWTVACRDDEDAPEPDVQAYLTDPNAELGLWYRLAPISYFGGGFGDDGLTRDPMEAAALGSAIIHGPQAGKYTNTIIRLASAQATQKVDDPNQLGKALGELLSPDHAAKLAQAAWSVESDGAEATEFIVALLCKLLDEAK